MLAVAVEDVRTSKMKQEDMTYLSNLTKIICILPTIMPHLYPAPQASLFSASNLDSIVGRRVITSSSEKVFEPTSILAIAAVGLGIVWRGKKGKQ